MSKLITPPNIINEDLVYLLVNPIVNDVEMLTRFLQINSKEFSVHLYFDGMSDTNWLTECARISTTILINKSITNVENIALLLDFMPKVVWFGENQTYSTATDYIYKNT